MNLLAMAGHQHPERFTLAQVRLYVAAIHRERRRRRLEAINDLRVSGADSKDKHVRAYLRSLES